MLSFLRVIVCHIFFKKFNILNEICVCMFCYFRICADRSITIAFCFFVNNYYSKSKNEKINIQELNHAKLKVMISTILHFELQSIYQKRKKNSKKKKKISQISKWNEIQTSLNIRTWNFVVELLTQKKTKWATIVFSHILILLHWMHLRYIDSSKINRLLRYWWLSCIMYRSNSIDY